MLNLIDRATRKRIDVMVTGKDSAMDASRK